MEAPHKGRENAGMELFSHLWELLMLLVNKGARHMWPLLPSGGASPLLCNVYILGFVRKKKDGLFSPPTNPYPTKTLQAQGIHIFNFHRHCQT